MKNHLRSLLPDKYKVRDFRVDDEFLTLYVYKVKDLGYNECQILTPREFEEVKYLVEEYFDCYCVVDLINKSIFCNLFI